MKLRTIVAATAAVAFAGHVAAQPSISGSSLNETSGGTYLGALPVGIVANVTLRDALQAAQLDASCVGNDSKTCMPSINSVELASITQAAAGQEWGNYGITAFGTGAFAATGVCGTIATNEAVRVGARHQGIGCTTSNPDGGFNNIINGLSAGVQNDVATCFTTANSFGIGAISFATADSQDALYRFVKLDGEAPDLANFQAGNYAMFADVHGGSLTGVETPQPWGTAGAVAVASNPPMHAQAGNFSISNECANGRLQGLSAGSGDLAN